ncbi:hypothetical protein MHM95_16410 [Pseudoalteromonas sp. CnMc7-15]|uniref:hypothetical protein n=1 Tax=unclassified Pseudoalteromonas TaxID=194690 RepID=UPI001EF50945|nr:hypothetical protein [Pseudoalteromonas sp. CnMc7-15]MCG7567856.1 hypothetical protein [Pseudoalteromonas sp. CnMc7-15]
MFKKFLSGLVFGSGFAIAFVFIAYLGLQVVIPAAINSSNKNPEFHDAKSAEVIEQETSIAPMMTTDNEFQLYKNAHAKMEVPTGGGILSITTIDTPEDYKHPSTFQLWITESEFWQVKTTEQNVEIEQLEYPNSLPIDAVDTTMRKQAGYAMSTMTVHSGEVASLKMGKSSWHDKDLNGKMKITEEGVVFIQPNEF